MGDDEDSPAFGGECSCEPVSFADLLQPFSVEHFTAEYWGKKPLITSLNEDILKRLRDGFGGGDIAQVLPQCRKDNNSKYSPEEMEKMNKDLDEDGKIVNCPFCFCTGADALRSSFIELCGGFGNDVEVGVYFSKLGGEALDWHFDNNHNITVQVCGAKDWRLLPGSPNTVASRGMQGLAKAPKNRYEQQCGIPPTSARDYTCASLRPGSVIYVPPGYWHAVTPIGGEDSFSIDIRVGNVLLCRWICEAIFSGLLGSFYSGNGSAPSGGSELLAVGPEDLGFGQPVGGAGVKRQLCHLASSRNLEAMLLRCKLPRCFPFQAAHTDGLHKGATLAFLKRKRFLLPKTVTLAGATIGVNGLISMLLKRRDERTLIIEIFSESSLSTMEYVRFSLLCDIALHNAVDLLVGEGLVPMGELRERCGNHKDLAVLLRVLLHANVLYLEPDPGPGQGGGAGCPPPVAADPVRPRPPPLPKLGRRKRKRL